MPKKKKKKATAPKKAGKNIGRRRGTPAPGVGKGRPLTAAEERYFSGKRYA